MAAMLRPYILHVFALYSVISITRWTPGDMCVMPSHLVLSLGNNGITFAYISRCAHRPVLTIQVTGVRFVPFPTSGFKWSASNSTLRSLSHSIVFWTDVCRLWIQRSISAMRNDQRFFLVRRKWSLRSFLEVSVCSESFYMKGSRYMWIGRWLHWQEDIYNPCKFDQCEVNGFLQFVAAWFCLPARGTCRPSNDAAI